MLGGLVLPLQQAGMLRRAGMLRSAQEKHAAADA